MMKKDEVHYIVKCHDSCSDIQVKVNHVSGDVDLYAKANSTPVIRNSNCKLCNLCKARSSKSPDYCEDMNTSGDQFYLAAVAHHTSRNVTLTFQGNNLQNVTTYIPPEPQFNVTIGIK